MSDVHSADQGQPAPAALEKQRRYVFDNSVADAMLHGFSEEDAVHIAEQIIDAIWHMARTPILRLLPNGSGADPLTRIQRQQLDCWQTAVQDKAIATITQMFYRALKVKLRAEPRH